MAAPHVQQAGLPPPAPHSSASPTPWRPSFVPASVNDSRRQRPRSRRVPPLGPCLGRRRPRVSPFPDPGCGHRRAAWSSLKTVRSAVRGGATELTSRAPPTSVSGCSLHRGSALYSRGAARPCFRLAAGDVMPAQLRPPAPTSRPGRMRAFAPGPPLGRGALR